MMRYAGPGRKASTKDPAIGRQSPLRAHLRGVEYAYHPFVLYEWRAQSDRESD